MCVLRKSSPHSQKSKPLSQRSKTLLLSILLILLVASPLFSVSLSAEAENELIQILTSYETIYNNLLMKTQSLEDNYKVLNNSLSVTLPRLDILEANLNERNLWWETQEATLKRSEQNLKRLETQINDFETSYLNMEKKVEKLEKKNKLQNRVIKTLVGGILGGAVGKVLEKALPIDFDYLGEIGVGIGVSISLLF